MPRRSDDFIEDYLKFVQYTESPLSYHLWACLGMISSTLERRVWMKWGHSDVYPNQYIILIGPSGSRKGEPLTIARSFLQDVNVTLVAEAITREALIRRMKNSLSSFDKKEGGNREVCFQSAVTCVIEEMAVFLESEGKFLADLTNWYDSRGKWTYETKGSGIDEVIGVCVNILGSMAPDWIPLTIPSSAIGGGFTSRIIFVVEHRKGQTITDPNKYLHDPKQRENLTADLEQIKTLSGEMIFDKHAQSLYEEWYAHEEQRTVRGEPAVKDTRFSGYVSRRATHIKKISMAISAAKSNSLVITKYDFERARLLLEQVEVNMGETFERIGRSDQAEQTQLVLNFIKERGKTTRRELMQQFYRDVDGKMIEIIERTLQTAGFITVKPDMDVGTMVYTWVG